MAMESGEVRSAPPTDGDAASRPAPLRLLSWLVLLPVWLWRATAALRQPRCRYHPSCSTYAVEAVRTHGSGRGSVLAARRVARCHPWNPGGIDPVPPYEQRDAWRRR